MYTNHSFTLLLLALSRFLLRFLFLQSSSQACKTPSLNEPHKSFASLLTNYFTLFLNFSLVSFLSFHTLHWSFRFIFMCLNRFSFFTSTSTNLCCNSQGITLTSFKNFLLSFCHQNKINLSFLTT